MLPGPELHKLCQRLAQADHAGGEVVPKPSHLGDELTVLFGVRSNAGVCADHHEPLFGGAVASKPFDQLGEAHLEFGAGGAAVHGTGECVRLINEFLVLAVDIGHGHQWRLAPVSQGHKRILQSPARATQYQRTIIGPRARENDVRFDPSAAGCDSRYYGRMSRNVLLLASVAAAAFVAAQDTPDLAFPGAEGFGAHARGGHGGRTFEVTTLNDSGPGSFRAACDASGPRVVVFRVAGVIDLATPINVTEPYLTVLGQTAPGEGICLKRSEFSVRTHDVIVRFLRSRPGDISGKEMDAMNIGGEAHDVIFDHCSATWSVDEALSPSGAISNITVQWCLIGEALNHSVHSKGAHGYGSLVRAVGGVTLHHNLWLHNIERNPRLGDNYGRGTAPVFDVRNNVMYDWGKICSGLTGDDLSANYVANYLRPGPNSSERAPIVLTPTAHVRYYVAGNVVEGRESMPMFSDPERVTAVDAPFEAPPVKTTSAGEAYRDVLAHVGAVCPVRDPVDSRLIREVEDRTGRIIDSQNDVGGWPAYRDRVLGAGRSGAANYCTEFK